MITMNQKVLCLYGFASNAMRRKWINAQLVGPFVDECQAFGFHAGLWTNEQFSDEAKAITNSIEGLEIPGLDIHPMTPSISAKINNSSIAVRFESDVFDSMREHYNALIPDGYMPSNRENLRSNIFALALIACAVPCGVFSDARRVMNAVRAFEQSVTEERRKFIEITNGFAIAAILDGSTMGAPLAEAVSVMAGICGEAKMDELLAHYAKGTQYAPGTTIN